MPLPPQPEWPRPKRWLLRAFERYSTRYVARHFHALRLLGDWPTLPAGRPLVIYLNHPSWWDPLTCLLLARRFLHERENYAPIDAAMAERYGFMKWLGFYPVEQGTRKGAARFLQMSETLLRRPNASLWLTPQGCFKDARERPVRLAAGLVHLARRVPEAIYLPLAMEYPFWTERTPEALAHFGAPATADTLVENLEHAMDVLAEAAMRRTPVEFSTMLGGEAGEGGIYQAWRRWRALWRGEHFQPEHGPQQSSGGPKCS